MPACRPWFQSPDKQTSRDTNEITDDKLPVCAFITIFIAPCMIFSVCAQYHYIYCSTISLHLLLHNITTFVVVKYHCIYCYNTTIFIVAQYHYIYCSLHDLFPKQPNTAILFERYDTYLYRYVLRPKRDRMTVFVSINFSIHMSNGTESKRLYATDTHKTMFFTQCKEYIYANIYIC